jgi:hypothetical protein
VSTDGDRDLERRFREARAADARRTPSYASALAPRRAPERTSRPRLALALAAVLMLVIAGTWRLATPNAPRAAIALTPGDMRVPTDYLLDLAPYSRAGEIPRIGAEDWYPVPLADDASPDTRRLP